MDYNYKSILREMYSIAVQSASPANCLKKNLPKFKPKGKIFVVGAIKHGVEETRANYIFDLMEKFAGYGFNKSHSVAYALLAYQTA